jgi:hypothetical protein
MYSKPELKQIFKKTLKMEQRLKRMFVVCNSTHYTEQNTEEVDAVKTFINSKIAKLSQIKTLAENLLQEENNSAQMKLKELISEFNIISNNAYLNRLQQIYTRRVNEEIMSI